MAQSAAAGSTRSGVRRIGYNPIAGSAGEERAQRAYARRSERGWPQSRFHSSTAAARP